MTRLDRCLNVADLRELARKNLPRPVFDFVDGGSEDEQTKARNRAAFTDWALLPKAMQPVSTVDPSTRLFGQDVAWPFAVGPTGMSGLVHRLGEAALARAAGDAGIPYVLSTVASRSIEEMAAMARGPLVFQLYLSRDRGISRELIQRAKQAGYAALLLTVDVPIPANRERDRRSGMIIPPRFGLSSVLDFAVHPGWVWDQLVRQPMRMANFEGVRAKPGTTLFEIINQQFDPDVSWDDVEWVASEWNGHFGVKGIMRPDDAVQAATLGVGSVILSNHGGRQLDAVASPIDVLGETVEQLAGRAEVIVDGGIRRGTDILKALALGAAGCMGGRVGLYGLGAGGAAGAHKAVKLLRDEFERDLALIGATTTVAVDRSSIMGLRN